MSIEQFIVAMICGALGGAAFSAYFEWLSRKAPKE